MVSVGTLEGCRTGHLYIEQAHRELQPNRCDLPVIRVHLMSVTLAQYATQPKKTRLRLALRLQTVKCCNAPSSIQDWHQLEYQAGFSAWSVARAVVQYLPASIPGKTPLPTQGLRFCAAVLSGGWQAHSAGCSRGGGGQHGLMALSPLH